MFNVLPFLVKGSEVRDGAHRLHEIAHRPVLTYVTGRHIGAMLGASSLRHQARQLLELARGAAAFHFNSVVVLCHVAFMFKEVSSGPTRMLFVAIKKEHRQTIVDSAKLSINPLVAMAFQAPASNFLRLSLNTSDFLQFSGDNTFGKSFR